MSLRSLRAPGIRACVTALLCGFCAIPQARADTLHPLPLRNQNPFIRIFGLPTPAAPSQQRPGAWTVRTWLDVTSYSVDGRQGSQELVMDGESYVLGLGLERQWGRRLSVGVEIPFIYDSGGFLDGTIDWWHDVLGVSIESREEAPRNRLLYSYFDDSDRVLVDDSSGGLGDVRVTTTWRLGSGERYPAAIQAGVKLPSGSDARLRGSGATDFSLALLLGHRKPWTESLRVSGSIGALALGDGDVLPGRQRDLVGFGNLTAGYKLGSRFDLLAQLDGHTSFYRSDLSDIGEETLLLSFGLRWHLSSQTTFAFAVSEDPLADTAPDVTFFLGLTTRR